MLSFLCEHYLLIQPFFLLALNLDVFYSFLPLFFQVFVFLKSTYFRYKFNPCQVHVTEVILEIITTQNMTKSWL